MHNHDLKNKSKVFGTGKCKSRMEVSGTTLFRTTQEKKPYFTDHYPFSILFWNLPAVGVLPYKKERIACQNVLWLNTIQSHIEAATKASTMDPLRLNTVRDAKTAF